MKFRKNFTHEFCVTNAFKDLGLIVSVHKETHFGFVRFLSENSVYSKFFHSRSQPAVRNFCSVSAVHSEPFKIDLNPFK